VEHFRIDNTEGYSQTQLDELNKRANTFLESESIAVPNDFDTAYNDTIYKWAMGKVQADYDTSLAAAALGKKGGMSKSDAKAAASRENGKKGGRPKKN
jgi:hypothetical protein